MFSVVESSYLNLFDFGDDDNYDNTKLANMHCSTFTKSENTNFNGNSFTLNCKTQVNNTIFNETIG